ncbi:unnamed protein product, partial [marine sediment metagenome]
LLGLLGGVRRRGLIFLRRTFSSLLGSANIHPKKLGKGSLLWVFDPQGCVYSFTYQSYILW